MARLAAAPRRVGRLLRRAHARDECASKTSASQAASLQVLRGHRGSVLALHGTGGLLLSGGRDHLIRVWDSETLVCRRTLR